MKLINVRIELVIDDDDKFLLPGETTNGMFTPMYNLDEIAGYLNNKLYNDPEFFGEFGPENIYSVENFE